MSLSNYTDTEIWNFFKNDKEGTLSYIYSKYSENLYQYGLKFTSNTPVIEDVLQDLFVDLIKRHKTLGGTDNINFYLLKSFKRKLLRKIQTEKRYKYSEDPFEYHFNITVSIENTLIKEEVTEHRNKMLVKALSELTPRQKEAIYLRFTKELQYKEIAEMMEISVEACRNLISKAIQIIKNWVSKRKFDPILLFVLLSKITELFVFPGLIPIIDQLAPSQIIDYITLCI